MYDFPPFLVGHTPEVRPAMVCPGHGRPQMMVLSMHKILQFPLIVLWARRGGGATKQWELVHE